MCVCFGVQVQTSYGCMFPSYHHSVVELNVSHHCNVEKWEFWDFDEYLLGEHVHWGPEAVCW